MKEITVKIDGMMCPMCESHINDCVRQNFKVKRVSSSRAKGESVIIADETIDEDLLKTTIGKTGYAVISVTSREYENKGLFSKLFGK